MQRSTISTIIEALKIEGLTEEIGEGESTGGRRPTMLRLRMAGPIAIGVAIRPSRTVIATSNRTGRVLEQEEFPTDPDPQKTLLGIISSVRKFSERNPSSIEAVEICLPGLVDPATGHATYIPHFNGGTLQSSRESPRPRVCRSPSTTMRIPLLWLNFGLAGPKLLMLATSF